MKWRKDEWKEVAAYLSGEMNPQGEIAFREQLLHRMDQEDLRRMEEQWKNMSQGETGETDKAWKQLHQRLEDDGLLVSDRRALGLHTRPILKIAASMLLILGMGIPGYFFLSREDTGKAAPMEHFAGEGTSTLDLPDGSRIYLNQGSSVSYPEDFRDNRDVVLEGEAFFEVMSDPVNPFTVRSGKVMVSVLGTSFNVKQEDKSGAVEVFVESGKVRMSLDRADNYITLAAGELGQAGKDLRSAETPPDPNYLAWKSKDFIFVEAQLAMVLETLERAYHVEIQADPELLRERQITSTYREQTIDSILETIATAFGYQVKKQNATYYLEP